ncbi:MAG: rod shape-determining protein MreC [Rhodovulum sulfidophilum]|uniref:Cell shape-determining protein MreC n=1 Tax=Rhodovulum sulfidophilum TaxID=35806 RepID=A0A2W5N7P9_RHOSU|nr:MAG: rod shape-determining protein MreC [Rhodovulum sulfidophilum]
MALSNEASPDYLRGLRRVLVGLVAALLIGLFLLWRIDNPRVERFRASLVDTFVPSFEWTLRPLAATGRMISDLRSYARVHEQNEELRRELQRMQGWREVALQLEQKNARLLALNNVRLNPRVSFVTAEVLADAGGPFQRSVMVNVGRGDGVADGAAAVDGLGLVGRIAGLGDRSARVLLLADPSSRVPVTILPSGQRAILTGDDTAAPALDFLDQPDEIRPGDRVVTSGDGGLFPADLLVGQVVTTPEGRQRVRLAADNRGLSFLRLLREAPAPSVEGPGGLIGPVLPPELARPAAVAEDRG